jgi:hypothetical protein
MKRKMTTLLALVLLAVPPASPYFLTGVPRTNDLLPHLYRTFALDRALRLGSLWPRWSPDLVHGYGYPVFNFFPSLSHWCIEIVHLTGLPITTSYRVVVFLHFVVAAAGSYWLGRSLFRSRAAGWAAAVVYTYNPYLLYDAHVRGAAQETQALALLPWFILALWHAGQPSSTVVQNSSTIQSWLARLQSPGWILATAVLFALTFLSHPIVYQLMIPIGLWLLLRKRSRITFDKETLPRALAACRNARIKNGQSLRAWFQSRQRASASHPFWQSLLGPVGGLGLGGLITAFF